MRQVAPSGSEGSGREGGAARPRDCVLARSGPLADARGDGGYSLPEVLVVVAIVSFVLIMAYTMIEQAARTSMFVETRNDLPVIAQGAINNIQSEMFQARQVFDSDPSGIGPGYLGVVKLPATYPLLTDSKLPLFNGGGDLVPDTTTRYTGNCLLLARQLAPITVPMGGSNTLIADLYQFEMIYLTKQTSRGFATQPFYLDLIRAKSAVYADYFQLSNISDQQAQKAINTALLAWVDPNTGLAAPIKQAWNPGQPIASALYDVQANGQYQLVKTPSIDLTVKYDTMLKGLTGGRISGSADYSVGFLPTAATHFPVKDVIPKYALYDPAKPLFPSGAEFLIVGPAGSRKALSRVMLMANYSVGRMTSKEVEVITAAR